MSPNRRFAFRPWMASACIPVLVIAQPALSGTNAFDGVYDGVGTVTFGTKPVCGSDGAVKLTVADGQIDTKFGDFPLKIGIAENGTFHGVVRVGSKGGRKRLQTNGTISNGTMKARLLVRNISIRSHDCTYHWSLKKE